MQDPLMPWYTIGGKSTLSHHQDHDHAIPHHYDTGSIPSLSQWSELTHNKQSFSHHTATSAQYDQQYQLLRKTPSIIGYEFTSTQQEEDQEQLNRRAALKAAIERSKSSISGRISRDCSPAHSRPASGRPKTAPARRPKSAASFISIGTASITNFNQRPCPQQRPRTAPTTVINPSILGYRSNCKDVVYIGVQQTGIPSHVNSSLSLLFRAISSSTC